MQGRNQVLEVGREGSGKERRKGRRREVWSRGANEVMSKEGGRGSKEAEGEEKEGKSPKKRWGPSEKGGAEVWIDGWMEPV